MGKSPIWRLDSGAGVALLTLVHAVPSSARLIHLSCTQCSASCSPPSLAAAQGGRELMTQRRAQYGDRAKGPPTGFEPSAVQPPIDYDHHFKTQATEQLKASRDYARSAKGDPLETVLGCVQALRRYGFCEELFGHSLAVAAPAECKFA